MPRSYWFFFIGLNIPINGGSKSYYNRIGLDQLTAKSSTELVQAILEGGQVVPELRELILGKNLRKPTLYGGTYSHFTGKWLHSEEGKSIRFTRGKL